MSNQPIIENVKQDKAAENQKICVGCDHFRQKGYAWGKCVIDEQKHGFGATCCAYSRRIK